MFFELELELLDFFVFDIFVGIIMLFFGGILESKETLNLKNIYKFQTIMNVIMTRALLSPQMSLNLSKEKFLSAY